MNTPALRTERLVLRKFSEKDMNELYQILKDKTVNRFLPWFPVNSMEETKKFYEKRYAAKYRESQAYAYAICLKEDDVPIGYIGVETDESHDLGFGLRREWWNQGIVTEAGNAVIKLAKEEGLPYITATHDRNNPGSGKVMQKLGMKYRYSYREQWQPKDIPVVFRMYQLNFIADDDFVYRKYWDTYPEHFIETV